MRLGTLLLLLGGQALHAFRPLTAVPPGGSASFHRYPWRTHIGSRRISRLGSLSVEKEQTLGEDTVPEQEELIEPASTGLGAIIEEVVENSPTFVGDMVDDISPVKRSQSGRLELDASKLVNLVMLTAAGGYALHSIATADSDVWRGWSTNEILLRIPYANWGNYNDALGTNPIFTKTAINVVIYFVGDWLSQCDYGNDGHSLLDFDLQRALRNALIGLIFGPIVSIYYDFSDWILPMDVPINRPLKIVMDQSIYFVAKCSAYIALVGLLRGDELEDVKLQWQDKIKEVVCRGWKFWPAAHIATYGFIPPQHRVLWVNCLDLIWSSMLAGMTSGQGPDTAEVVVGEEAENDDA
ncbi:unnamed protein product [Chrysoparadoxa australica]